MRFESKRLAMLAVVALMLAACGSDTTETTSDDDTNVAMESPLAEYMGLDTGFDFGDEAAMEAKQLEINEQVTACMAAEGFEWQPNPMESIMAGPADEGGLEYGSEEWVAKYGFSISTMAFPQEVVGADLIGYSDESFMGVSEEEFSDPNEEYLNTLSDSERDAYYATLYGDDQGPDIDFEAMTEEEIEAAMNEYYADYVPTGCMNEAQEDIMGFGGRDYFIEFQSELEELYEQIENDPRLVELEQDTAECVSDKGLIYTTAADVRGDLEERMQPLYMEAYETDPMSGLTEEQMNSMTDDQLNELMMPRLSDESLDVLAEIQADELELAAAVVECGGSVDGPWNTELFNEVRIEYEQRFIDDNKAALDAFLAEQESSGSSSDEEG